MAEVFQLFGTLDFNDGNFAAKMKGANNSVEGLKSNLSNLDDSVADAGAAFSKFGDKLKQTGNGIRNIGAEIGRNVGRGLSNGLQAGSAGAISSAKSIASRLISSVKATLGIRSPSTVFYQIGRDIMSGLGNGLQSGGAGITALITAPILAIGGIAVKSAFEIDKIRQSLVGVEGGAEQANAKMRELQAFSMNTKGVTLSLAAETYSSLKPLGVGQAIIKKETEALGKLGQGADFSRNLLQIFQQGFERGDIKEAIGRVPLFEQLLGEVQKKFGVKDVAGLKKLKESGKLTVDQFLEGFSDAVNSNPNYANVGESLSTKLAKSFERLDFALAPLGDKIIAALEPVIQTGIEFVEKLGAGFAALSPFAQNLILAFAGIAAAVGPVIVGIGTLVVGVGAVIGAFGAIAGAVATLGGLGIVAVIIAGLVVQFGAFAIAATVLTAALASNFGGITTLLTDVFTAVSNVVTTSFASIVAYFQTNGAAIVASFQSTFNSIRNFVEPVVTEIVNFIRQSFEENKETITQILAQLSTTFATAFKGLSVIVASNLASIAEFWKQYGSQITSTVSAIWTQVKAVISGGMKLIANVILLTLAAINGDWSTALNALKGIASGVIQAVVGIFRGLLSATSGIFRGIVTLITNAGTEIYSAALGIGRNIVEGMVRGITGGQSKISGAINGMVTNAVTTAKAGLKEQSPSKVFFEIGSFVGQGFVNGIVSMQSAAKGAIENLVSVPNGLNRIALPIGKIGAADKDGVDLLKGLYESIDKVNVSTKLEETLVTLKTAAYAKLSPLIREAIINAAAYSDSQKSIADGTGALVDFQNKLNEALRTTPKTLIDEANELLERPEVAAALNARGDAAARLSAELLRLTALAAILKKQGEDDNPFLDDNAKFSGGRSGNEDGITPPETRPRIVMPKPEFDDWELPPRIQTTWKDFFEVIRTKLEELNRTIPSIREELGSLVAGLPEKIGDIFGNAIQNFDGSFKSLFSSIGQGFVQLLKDMAVQMIKSLVIKLITKLIGGFAGGGSVGEDGGGGGNLFGFAGGGNVFGAGTGTSDSILAMLSNGEFVQPTKAVNYYGRGFMESIRSMQYPKMAFASGGLASVSPQMSSNDSSQSRNAPMNPLPSAPIVFNVTTKDADSFRRSKGQIAREYGAALDRIRLKNS